MSDRRSHQWFGFDGYYNGSRYVVQACELCHYMVMAYPLFDEPVRHLPDFYSILVKGEELSQSDAERWMKHFGLICEDRPPIDYDG